MITPRCFSLREYKDWLAAARAFPGGKGRTTTNVCLDCSPTYQAEMIAAGRCDHPNVVFRYVAGEFVGIRMKGLKP